MSDAPVVLPTRTNLSRWLTTAGQIVSRYGLVVVLAWIGFGKFAKMEARVLIEHSPLMSWMYDFLSVGAVAKALGTAEIVAALLIALRAGVAESLGGGQRDGSGAVPRHVELLVHDSGPCGNALRRPTCPRCPAGPVSAQGSGADRCGGMDPRGCPRRAHETRDDIDDC